MAFNAGAIEATLTLNRNPFTAGLKAARAQAERARFPVTLRPRLDQSAMAAIRTRIERTVYRPTIRPQLDRSAFERIQTTLNRSVGRVTIRPRLDREAFERIRNTISRTVGRITIRVNLDRESLLAVRAEIEAMRPEVTVRVNWDRDNLDELLARLNGIRDASVRVGNAASSAGRRGQRAFAGMDGTVRAVLGSLPLLLPVGGAAIVGLTGLVGGLISALGTAGAGVAAFGAVAIPVYTKIAEAVKEGQAAIDALPPGLREAAGAMQGLTGAYEALVERVQGGVGYAMAAGFDAATAAVQTLDPVINAASVTFERIGRQIERYFGTAHWQTFIDFIAANFGPTMQAVADIVFYFTRAMMNLVIAMDPLADWLLGAIVQGMKDFAHWTGQLANDPAFIQFLEQAKSSLTAVWEFLKSVVAMLWNLSMGLAPLGDAILDVLTKVFNGLAKMPPEWLGAIAMGLSGIVAALVLFGTGPAGLAAGVIFGTAGALTALYNSSKPVREALDAIIIPLRDWLIPLMDRVQIAIDERVLPAWNRFVDSFRTHVLPVIQTLWREFQDKVLPALSDLVGFIFEQLIPAFLNFKTAIMPTVAWFMDMFGSALITEFQNFVWGIQGLLGILAGIFNTVTGLLTGNWSLFWKGMRQIGEGALRTILAIFGISLEDFYSWWQNFWGTVTSSWNNFWNGMLARFQRWASDLAAEWNAFWSWVWGHITGWWNTFTTWWQNFWNDLIGRFRRWAGDLGREWNNFWSGIWDFATHWLGVIERGIHDGLDTVQRWFSGAIEGIRRIWAGLKEAAAAPVRFVVNTVWNDGIRRAWNWVANLLPGIDPVGPVVLPFARGGRVPGYAPGQDTVPAMLSPGEYVINPRAARAIGPKRLDQLNDAHQRALYADGGEVQKFQAGGPVWQSLWQAVSRRFPEARLTSAFRPGDPGFHGSGQAIDVAGPRPMDMPTMLAINQWIARTHRNITELIHTQPGAINIDNGSPHTFSPAVRANHRDHVHWAMAQGSEGGGGWFNPLPGMIRGFFETVTNPLINALPSGPPAFLDVPRAMATKARDSVLNWLLGQAESQGPSGNMSLAPGTGPIRDQVQAVARAFGWGSGAQWNALVRLIQKESSWNPTADNPTSTAFGLFQFLDSTRAAYGIGMTTNPRTQAVAGLNYIQDRYGSPAAALAFHNRNNWYDEGGMMPPGPQIVNNTTGHPERVLTPSQTENFDRLVQMSEELISAMNAFMDGRMGDTYNIQTTPNANAHDIIRETTWAAKRARRRSSYR